MRTKVRGLHIIFHHILKDLLAQMLTILSSNNLQQGVLAGVDSSLVKWSMTLV